MIEVFNPETCLFLSLQIPRADASACTLFVENNQLVLMSANYVSRWMQEGEHSLVQLYEIQHPSYDVLSNMPPVVDSVNSLIYFSLYGRCFCMDLFGTELKEIR